MPPDMSLEFIRRNRLLLLESLRPLFYQQTEAADISDDKNKKVINKF